MEKINNRMDDGSLSQIEKYEGTTQDPLVKIEERDLHSKTEALKLVRQNGVFFPALGARMKRDKEVVLEAIRSHPYAIMDLPVAVRKDPDVQRVYQDSLSKKNGGVFKKQKLTAETKRILILMEQTERERLMALEMPETQPSEQTSKSARTAPAQVRKPATEMNRSQRSSGSVESIDDLFGEPTAPKSLVDLLKR